MSLVADTSRIKYLSPSALSTWEKSAEAYYMQYVLRVPREPQTGPMAIGSAFDAYVKSSLARDLFGNQAPPALDFEPLFESQVEPHNRSRAVSDGAEAFGVYKVSGAYSELLTLLAQCDRVELDLKVERTFDPFDTGIDLVIHGRPDLYFVNCDASVTILDWKVNGFYSVKVPSPKPGYFRCRGWDGEDKQHKGYRPTADTFEWADQLLTYKWVMGHNIGSADVRFWIEQIIGRVSWRLAQHIIILDNIEYEKALLIRYQSLWLEVKNGFPSLSTERKAELSVDDPLFRSLTREC